MKPCLIVGGGVAGLFAARILKSANHEFVGVETSEQLGGRTLVGHHRLYEKGSMEFFRLQFPELEFDFVDESPAERRKGAWEAVGDDLGESEKYYLGQSYYFPRAPYSRIVEELVREVGKDFLLRTHITDVRHSLKIATTSSGNEIEYSKLIWCAPLEALPKVWGEDKSILAKSMKQLDPAAGGINLDMELSAPLFPNRNTVIFPFRYKEFKLRALGMAEQAVEGTAVHPLRWLVILDEDFAEDREEVAKCVRALKRELLKEFPELKERLTNERIVFLPKVPCETPATVKSLELVPDLIYLGAQVRLANSKEEPRDLDRILDNCQFFEGLFTSPAAGNPTA